MGVSKKAEIAIDSLLKKAAEATTFEDAAQQTERALEIARTNKIRVARRDLPVSEGGIEGHYGRMDGARVFLTGALIVGVIAVLILALVKREASLIGDFVSPLSGLVGLCLGWLFTQDNGRSVLEAYLRAEEQKNKVIGSGDGTKTEVVSTTAPNSTQAPISPPHIGPNG